MGLLEDIVRDLKNWVREFIDNKLVPLRKWVLDKIADAIKGIQQVTNNIFNYVTNKFYETIQYITRVYNNVTENIYNTINNITQNITNNITNITKNITNIIGASSEWVLEQLSNERSWTRNFFKLMDPIGFLKDPVGHMKAVFSLQRQAAETAVIKSFWEGLEEGLTE